MSDDDNRRFSRIKMINSVQIKCMGGGLSCTGITREIGEDGCMLQTLASLGVGDLVVCEMLLGNFVSEVIAKVVKEYPGDGGTILSEVKFMYCCPKTIAFLKSQLTPHLQKLTLAGYADDPLLTPYIKFGT